MINSPSPLSAVYTSASLSETDLDNLLNALDDESASSSPAFKSLIESAKQGNSGCIEIMQQIALRHDAIGTEAEKVLFNLFSGNEPAQAGITKDIEQQSLKLYEIVSTATLKVTNPSIHKNIIQASASNQSDGKDATFAKLSSPSKLLYMAGAGAVSSRADAYVKEIADVFKNDNATKGLFTQSSSDAELWSSGRFMEDIELDVVTRTLKPSDQVFICANTTAAQLPDIVSFAAEDIKDKSLSLFPIQANNHFMTFGAYEDKGQRKAFFFSSLTTYYNGDNAVRREGVRKHVVEAARNLGIAENDISVIEADLQNNAPNACGLFTLEAVKLLAHDEDKASPVEKLNAFIKEFMEKDATAQQDFNINNRRQIHGALIEAAKNSDGSPRVDGHSSLNLEEQSQIPQIITSLDGSMTAEILSF